MCLCMYMGVCVCGYDKSNRTASTWQEIVAPCLCVFLTDQRWPPARDRIYVNYGCVCCWQIKCDRQHVTGHGWTVCVFAVVRTRRWPPEYNMTVNPYRTLNAVIATKRLFCIINIYHNRIRIFLTWLTIKYISSYT